MEEVISPDEETADSKSHKLILQIYTNFPNYTQMRKFIPTVTARIISFFTPLPKTFKYPFPIRHIQNTLKQQLTLTHTHSDDYRFF